MVLKAERERVKALLTEAITVLCKNGLGYKYTCAIEGLLGITLDDDDVFLVNINESIQKAERPPPVEESTKQETGTQSPASSSPSSTPRRRRRRSQEGEGGHSPAKRANYGTEQDQSRTQPQSREDVIVIKEEVSETEFSDFYGDGGGGNNEDSGQYAMQQDQQYPGAGCSQWDTSQTQGGQSDWPAFNPTQQQQQAISQAASSAMMSPSQMSSTTSSMATLPSMKLRSRPVCDILNQQIITPVMNNKWSVSAFRMAWTRQMDVQQIWDQIVVMRAELDRLIRLIPGVLFVVSAINATPNQGKAGGETAVLRANPGVAYWLVSPQVVIDQRTLCNHMHSNHCAATLKLALQPYQTTEKDIRNALFSCVKDNMEGCVRRLVEESCAHCYGPTERLREPLVKVYVGKGGPREMVTQAFDDLTSVRFRSEVLDLEIQ